MADMMADMMAIERVERGRPRPRVERVALNAFSEPARWGQRAPPLYYTPMAGSYPILGRGAGWRGSWLMAES
jgi:hypothetical protein